MQKLKYLPIMVAFASLSFNGCTSSLLVKSAWNANQIVIDGKDNDWDDTMFYIPDAQLTAGVRNDSNYMYIILKTTNRMQTFQMLGLGLTVWFDPSGGTSQKFGIHFPLGRGEGGGEMSQPPSTTESQPSSTDNVDSENENQSSSFVGMMPNQLELLGVNENGPVRLTIVELKGIELQMSHDRDGLIYEMRVPLYESPDNPYAINPKGKAVGIEFVTGKFEPRNRGEETARRGEGEGTGGEGGGGGGEEPGGMGGYGGGGYGGMRGGGGGRGGRRSGGENGGQTPQQIDFWLKVQLAESTTQ